MSSLATKDGGWATLARVSERERLTWGSGRETRDSRRRTGSLFERFSWLYAFCREHLFRDDTEQIASALWPREAPAVGSQLVELGCGPGFYACRLAEHFGQLRVIGVDRSEHLLRHARARAAARRLANCRFEQADVLALPWPGATADALVASRLFTVLVERERALAEMYRVLRPGGRCFIAEPRSALRAAAPLRAMWLLAWLAALCGDRSAAYREPRRIAVLTVDEFGGLVGSQPWRRVWRWQDTRYQYAVAEKGGGRVGLKMAA